MTIAERLALVQARVREACVRAGRDPAEVGLVAVSKTHPVGAVEAALAAGQRDFGENYGQELRDKAAALEGRGVRWHYVGRIQSNKAKYIAPHGYRVHALDTVEHAEALAARAPGPLSCLVTVNVAGEQTKSGVEPDEAIGRCEALSRVAGIEIVGLMCMPPPVDDPRTAAPWFAALAEIAAEGRRRGFPLTELSMGMSHDFEVAIEHGATWVRVGTAIFGARGTA